MVFRDGHRVVNHAVLGPLHPAHVGGLLGDGHVLMDDTQAAFTRHGDRRLGLRHRIHRSGQERNVQFDLIGQIGFQLDFLGQHLAAARNQQNIIKS